MAKKQSVNLSKEVLDNNINTFLQIREEKRKPKEELQLNLSDVESTYEAQGYNQQFDGSKRNKIYPELSDFEVSLVRPPLEKFIKKKKKKDSLSPKDKCAKDGFSPDPKSSPKTKSELKTPEKEEQVDSSPPHAKESSAGFNFLGWTLAIIVLLLAVFLYIYLLPYFFDKPLNKELLDVKDLIDKLKSNFDSLPLLTYRVIEAAIKNAASENRKAPGIILLLSSKEAKDTTKQLADKLVASISKPSDIVSVGSESSDRADQLKKQMDVTFQSNLNDTQSGLKAVLVKSLDRIPFEAAMILHSYCDHENAPFKKVVYVMTVFLNEEILPDSSGKKWDYLASKHLKTAWRESGEDQVVSLISRLTVSVAAVVGAKN